MRVKLFTTSDDSRVVHKKLTNEIEISAHVIRDMDILNPSLLLLYNEDVPFKYNYMFIGAATKDGACITVNYIADASTLVDNMIATKSASSNIVKGSQI